MIVMCCSNLAITDPKFKETSEIHMSSIQRSLLQWCFRHRIERFRGGYRLERVLGESLPIAIENSPPVYIDMLHPNWQARELFSHNESIPWNYERHVSETLRQLLRSGDVVYDIGANIGLHTILLHKLGAKVFAFEPNPALIPNLQRTIRALPSAQLLPVALSDQSGTATLFVPVDHDMASLGNWREETERRQCSMTTLDALDLPRPDLIKCDVEGAELRVFRGGQSCCPIPKQPPSSCSKKMP